GCLLQRVLMMLFCLSMPLLWFLTHLNFYVIPVLGILFFISFRESDSTTGHAFALLGAGVVISVSSIVDPGLVLLSIWMTVVVVLSENDRKIENRGILVSGGYVVLLIAGLLVSYLHMRGQFPSTTVYSFPDWNAWAGAFISRKNGIISVAPWILLAISGWIMSLNFRNKTQLAIWLGWPLVLSGLIISTWMRTGETLDMSSWLVSLVCLIPFTGSLWPSLSRTFLAGIMRVLVLLSLSISMMFWVIQVMREAHGYTLNSLLEIITAQSGVELKKLIPMIAHAFPVISVTGFLWMGMIVISILIILISARSKKTQTHNYNVDLIVITVVILLAGFGIRSSRTWYRVPMETEKILHSGESWIVELQVSRPITAIELETRLSRSAHMKQGVKVAEIISEKKNMPVMIGELRAGIDTAEWAYDRPDVLKIIRHDRPEISKTWTVTELNGTSYKGHAFRSSKIYSPPLETKRLTIRNILDNEDTAILTVSQLRLFMGPAGEIFSEPYQLDIGETLDLSSANPEKTIKIEGYGRYQGIVVDSFLENSASVTQGKIVAQILIKSRNGVATLWLMRAGIDTAEWSIERPDMVGHVAHTAADCAVSDRRFQGESMFLANTYRGKWDWEPAFDVTEVVLKYLLDEEKYPNCRWITKGILLY
ncbi:hypothetical protein K8T06_03360, partial [bacterium]|nr:hypothetical protein [bacterium]